MENIKITPITLKKVSFFEKVRTSLRNAWNDLNDPQKIYQRSQRPLEGRILDNTAMLIATAIIVVVALAVASYTANAVEKYAACAIALASLATFVWLCNYRKAIATSKTAREKFIECTKTRAQKLFRVVVRATRNICITLIGAYGIALALLMFVPQVAEVAPGLHAFSDAFVNTVDGWLFKLLDFIS